MATIQAILDDVKLRYKHTFTNEQVLVWMNEEQRELFEILEIDSVPFSFSTVKGQYLYPIPYGVEINRIKVLTYQINDTDFIELPYLANDNNVHADAAAFWYSIVENNFYLNLPDGPPDNRLIYIYLDQQPEDMTSSALNVEPAVPLRYQELLKLGTLKRIAAARKDIESKNNYEADYEQKVIDLEWKMKMQQPEFMQPTNSLPRRSRTTTVNWW